MEVIHIDCLIIGSGIAGLFCALNLKSAGGVAVLSKGTVRQSATSLAQGGIAAALAPGDSPALHALDTICAGNGACVPEAVEILVNEGPLRVQELTALGVPFDTHSDGTFRLAMEGAHSRARIIPAGGDGTGKAVAEALIQTVRKLPNIGIHEETEALDLLLHRGRCVGAVTVTGGEFRIFATRAVVLATGGYGRIFQATTSGDFGTGDGLAMAYRAGARLADMEFVQFHPTALDSGEDPLSLISEAVRGHGAMLVTRDGDRFMTRRHSLAELAPRDVVARAIFEQQLQAHRVFLDATSIGDDFPQRFPFICSTCRERAIDPVREWLPVTPAAHFTMGGVLTDMDGATNVPGLFACGEVACTGVHGANRLASNSLLEGLVFSHRVAQAVCRDRSQHADSANLNLRTLESISGPFRVEAETEAPDLPKENRFLRTTGRLRQCMWRNVGLIRSRDGLLEAKDFLDEISLDIPNGQVPLGNMILVARLVTEASVLRRESRGSHCRGDFPHPVPFWENRRIIFEKGSVAYESLACGKHCSEGAGGGRGTRRHEQRGPHTRTRDWGRRSSEPFQRGVGRH